MNRLYRPRLVSRPASRRSFTMDSNKPGDTVESLWNKYGSRVIAYGTPILFAWGFYKFVYSPPTPPPAKAKKLGE